MFTDEIVALRKNILERQERTQRKRHIRSLAGASVLLGIIIASALGGGIRLERGRQGEGIKSHSDQTKAVDNVAVEVLPNTLLDEIVSMSDQSFVDDDLQGTVDLPLCREGLLPVEQRFVDYGSESVLMGSQDSTETPGPMNKLQQAGLPVEKPKEKSPSTDTYGVQIASVFTEHDARKEKARLIRKYQKELENLSIFVVRATHENFGTCYRIVAGKTDKKSAREICGRLSEIGKECLLVKVEEAENRSP